MFSKIFIGRPSLDEESKRKASRVREKERSSSISPFLLDIFKARGAEHGIVRLKARERSSKKFLEHCDFLQSIVSPAKLRPRDSMEVKQAVSNIPVLLAASIQPLSADKYLREFQHFVKWGVEN